MYRNYPLDSSEPRARVADAILLSVVSFALLTGFAAFLDNSFIINTNGLWKSVYVRAWAENPGTAPVDFANLLYFPVYGRLCRVLELLGIYQGQTWRQMALLNSVFASAGLGIIYLWIMTAFRSRAVALLTTLLYAGTGFFLALALINEDIMPSYIWMLSGMIMAGLWFGHPTALRIVLVSSVVAVGWLFEWRLMFPVVPPLLATLWISVSGWRARFRTSLVFVLGSLILPSLLSSSLIVRGTCDNLTNCLQRMLWTGKGIGTGWAGFSAAKLRLSWVGISESLFGGRFIGSDHWYRHPAHVLEVSLATAALAVLVTIALRYAHAKRRDPCVRSHLIVFGGVFLCGELFNLYSQPHDPQMQLTVMPWIIPVSAVLIARFLSVGSAAPRSAAARLTLAQRIRLAVLLCLLPLVYNASVLARSRGGDSLYHTSLANLERYFDPRRTVFLYRGFEFVVPWQWARWSATNPGVSDLGPPPQNEPKFKWISVAETLIRHPDWSAEQKAAEVADQIEEAMRRGYDVIAGSMWGEPIGECIDQFLAIAPPAHTRAIHRELNRRFVGEPVYEDAASGAYFRLSRRAPSFH